MELLVELAEFLLQVRMMAEQRRELTKQREDQTSVSLCSIFYQELDKPIIPEENNQCLIILSVEDRFN